MGFGVSIGPASLDTPVDPISFGASMGPTGIGALVGPSVLVHLTRFFGFGGVCALDLCLPTGLQIAATNLLVEKH